MKWLGPLKSLTTHFQEPVPPVTTDEGAAPSAVKISSVELVTAMATIATHAWKAQQRLKSEGGEEGDALQRKLARHVDGILDALAAMGITFKDRTGEPFDYGLPEKVIASEPRAGINRPMVVETLRPAIYWNAQILQHGEVVLATPLDNASAHTTEPPASENTSA